MLADIAKNGTYPVPPHLRDAHYSGAKDYGHGVGYVYTHEQPDTQQDFLPSELVGKQYVENRPSQRVGKKPTVFRTFKNTTQKDFPMIYSEPKPDTRKTLQPPRDFSLRLTTPP